MIYKMMALWKECEVCGCRISTNGHFVKHKSGTVTAHVYNMESRCPHCRAKEQDLEDK